MFVHMKPRLLAAETVATGGSLTDVLPILRGLSLDNFGRAMLEMPNPSFPALSRVLPAMASEQVQRDWTGNAGLALLQQSLNFVRSVALQSALLTGRPLQGRRLLDFGCGYGRLLRLMYYFSDPELIWGVDPWDRSIELCREAGLPNRFAQSDYLPTSLPVEDETFGLIYAFSVFTHTSERATRQALATLRNYIEPDGMLVVTIRPHEYWDHAAPWVNRNLMREQHTSRGFAFTPHNREPIDGDITYGDTSMTFDWLVANAPGWRLAGYDHTLDDVNQIIVYLQPG
jgi:SAM-dependent methyltransferase